MNTYILMQAPEVLESTWQKAIVMVNKDSAIGKKRYEKFINNGYAVVGEVKSKLKQAELADGFTAVTKLYVNALEKRLKDIKKIAAMEE